MVYLLHFDRPLHHAKHYLGYTGNLEQRLALHANPDGSSHHALIRAVRAAGIGFQLARTWADGDRAFERQLKRQKHGPRLCPICSQGKAPRAPLTREERRVRRQLKATFAAALATAAPTATAASRGAHDS